MKVKQLTCPICGKERPEFDFIQLKDGMICIDCADELAVAYPVSFYRNPNYKSIDSFERKNSGYLISFAKGYERTTEDNGQPFNLRRYQGIEELSVAEYHEKLQSLEGVRMQLRRKYGAEAVFQVQGGFPLKAISPFEVGIFEARKLQNAYLYVGRCIVGEYTRKDAATLIHTGNDHRSEVLGASRILYEIDLKSMEKSYNEKDKEYKTTGMSWFEGLKQSKLIEGYPGYLILVKGSPVPTPGDLIIKM